jgi:hypothetical protein
VTLQIAMHFNSESVREDKFDFVQRQGYTFDYCPELASVARFLIKLKDPIQSGRFGLL